MKPSSTVFVSLILISDIFAFANDWKQKAEKKLKLQSSNLFVKCGKAEYTTKEIDEAAAEACYRKFTKGKWLGIPIRSQPKPYKGTKLITFDEDSQSSHHFSRHTYHYNTHVLNFEDHPLLMWPLKNKIRHINAKCYAIIKWYPKRVACKAIAVIMRERERDEIKCNQVTIRDTRSRYAASPIYHPDSPNIHHPEVPIPFSDPYRRSSSAHETTRAPPFNSNLQETTNEIPQAPSFRFYPNNIHSDEITEQVD